MSITVYSTGCPKCEILKRKLNDKNMEYTEVTDITALNEKNIRHVPVMEIGGKYLDFNESIKLINKANAVEDIISFVNEQ